MLSGFVNATTSSPLLRASSQTASVSGPNAGSTSARLSPVCFSNSAINCGVPGKRPARSATFLHWSEEKSVFNETNAIEDAGAMSAPSGSDPPPPPPPQPAATATAARTAPAQTRLI